MVKVTNINDFRLRKLNINLMKKKIEYKILKFQIRKIKYSFTKISLTKNFNNIALIHS